MEVCYLMTDGTVCYRHDMVRAFYISTGMKAAYHEFEYLRWLNSLFGTSIKMYFKPTVPLLIMLGERVGAVRLYREENGCSIMEAKEAVDELSNKIGFGSMKESIMST